MMNNTIAGIYKCWDHQNLGIDVVRERLINEIEKAKRDGIKLQRLAMEMEERLVSDKDWTVEDAKILKEIFSLYNISFIIKL